MKKNDVRRVTVQELIEQLKKFHLEDEVIFADDQLTFFRAKKRDNGMVQIEFNEVIKDVLDLSGKVKR